MKIHEAEQLAGITRVNIRFYEKEGLLTPGRSSENGYRDYSSADVEWLKKIRLLRMLDLPIEEILLLRSGGTALPAVMGDHARRLSRRQSDLAAMEALCRSIGDSGCSLGELDADRVLAEMERKEQEGMRFMDVKKKDRRTRYVGPVAAAVVMILLMGGVAALLIGGVVSDPAAPGWLWAFLLLPAAVVIGVVLALLQRIKQIKGGEEDAASQY